MGTMDGTEFLITIKNTKNNADFFDSMNKSATTLLIVWLFDPVSINKTNNTFKCIHFTF